MCSGMSWARACATRLLKLDRCRLILGNFKIDTNVATLTNDYFVTSPVQHLRVTLLECKCGRGNLRDSLFLFEV